MSKYKKWRYTIHYVKPTAQLLFKSRFSKDGPTCRRHLDGANTDGEKCTKILSVITGEGDPVIPVLLTRLGKQGQGKNRPLLARLTSKATRDSVLTNTKALKDAGAAYKNVYVKQDVHTAIRQEWKPLEKVGNTEKQNPANQGMEVCWNLQERHDIMGNNNLLTM